MLVYTWVMETSVDEVNAEIGEDEEEWELKPVVIFERFIRESIVES